MSHSLASTKKSKISFFQNICSFSSQNFRPTLCWNYLSIFIWHFRCYKYWSKIFRELTLLKTNNYSCSFCSQSEQIELFNFVHFQVLQPKCFFSGSFKHEVRHLFLVASYWLFWKCHNYFCISSLWKYFSGMWILHLSIYDILDKIWTWPNKYRILFHNEY